MTLRIYIITTFLCFTAVKTSAQQDTLIRKLDSLNRSTDSAGGQSNNTNPTAYNENTKITFKSYFTLLGSDLKQEFTKPFHMTRKDWGRFGKFALVGTALAFGDEPIQRNAAPIIIKNDGVRRISKFVTNFGGIYEAYTLGALGAYGFIFKKEKIKTTTLLATQAYFTGGALESVLKYVTGRTRPSFYGSNEEAEPRFLGPFSNTAKAANGKNSYSSFPSGHTTVAFAAATVFALEYKNRPLVPIVAYSAATLIGLSRITENKHWATDVFVGAAIGYLAGRNVVNNYHRYARLKSPNKKKNTSITLNMGYQNRQLLPNVQYRF